MNDLRESFVWRVLVFVTAIFVMLYIMLPDTVQSVNTRGSGGVFRSSPERPLGPPVSQKPLLIGVYFVIALPLAGVALWMRRHDGGGSIWLFLDEPARAGGPLRGRIATSYEGAPADATLSVAAPSFDAVDFTVPAAELVRQGDGTLTIPVDLAMLPPTSPHDSRLVMRVRIGKKRIGRVNVPLV
ncbi:MAG TPA: hypothetical protein VF618_02255 [Thermoanaerobaculia bacterium]